MRKPRTRSSESTQRLVALQKRVEQSLGLDLDSADIESLDRLRARAAKSADVDSLAQELLVHETWFFRDPAVFEALAELAGGRTGPTKLRVLSAPCATGEEAYSIAIALREAGLAAGSFEVVGADVGERAIAHAVRGRYGKTSFRSTRRDWEARWLERTGDESTVCAEIRDNVRFREANLVAADALVGEPPFDVVMCRNLWVYLTPEARGRLEAMLVRVLAPGGTLFMGHAEAPDHSLFERFGPPAAFMFRRASAHSETRLQTPRALKPRKAPKVDAKAPASPPRAPATPPTAPSPLAGARKLADAGDLEGAAAMCEQALREHGHDAEAYALLGTIENARGRRDEAMRAWQRAIYLDPAHPVALLQLALVLRERGESARADALIERAHRSGRGS